VALRYGGGWVLASVNQSDFAMVICAVIVVVFELVLKFWKEIKDQNM
jgi:hypothetical protein